MNKDYSNYYLMQHYINANEELLVALKEAVFHLQGYLVQYGHTPTMDKKMKGFKAAIAKAEGKEVIEK